MPVIESSGSSHVGPVRQDNQDAIYLPNVRCPPGAGQLFAVADGMGGYAHGEVASSMAIEKLIEVVNRDGLRPNPKNLRRGVESANLSVYKAAGRMGTGQMGTTLTAAYILEDDLHLIHVGDCRAYLIRGRQAICLTSDHTTVGDLVRMKIISADKVRTHSQRSILTKAIGIGLFVQPDISQIKLQEKDCLILCSDGVWSVVQDEEFAQVAMESSAIDQVSRRLVALALERETDDNVSVIAIHIRELLPAWSKESKRPEFDWFKNRRQIVR